MAEGEIKLVSQRRAGLDELHRAPAVSGNLHREPVAVVVGETVKGDADLLQVAQALEPLAAHLRLGHDGQQQSRENGYDCDHDQQFDQGEGLSKARALLPAVEHARIHFDGKAKRIGFVALDVILAMAFESTESVTCWALPSARPTLPLFLCISAVQAN